MIKEYNEKIINIEVNENERIYCVYNYIDENKPLIIIPPQFEKTIRNNLTIMVHLINNGFNVLRYDNRNHNGNSTGEIENFSLRKVLEDFEYVIDYLKANKEVNFSNGVGVVGISIASRAIYRYLSEKNGFIDVFIVLVGVINMKYTLNSIVGFDSVQECIDNPSKKFGVRKVLNYPINWDIFLNEMIQDNMHNIDSTIEDVKKIKTPIYMVMAEKDKWVNIDECDAVFNSNREILKDVYKLPNTGHELYKNPESAKYAIMKIVEMFKSYFNQNENEELVIPTIAEIVSLNRNERQREKKYRITN